MCPTGKIPYDSPREARAAALAFKGRTRNYSTGKRVLKNKTPQRSYWCEICGKYHLTSKN